jgi:hypothetical protein
MEAWTNAIQAITTTGREQGLSSENCRQCSWLVANRQIARTDHGFANAYLAWLGLPAMIAGS